MEYARVLLKPPVTLSDVDRTGAFADDWEVADITLVKKDQPYTKTWTTEDVQTKIRYIQDPLREVRYFHLTGANPGHHLAHIRESLPTYDRAEIEEKMRTAGTPVEKVAAVYHAAVSAPAGRDPATFDFLTRALVDTAPVVRRAAIDSALVVLWVDLREPLERVAAADPEQDLRDFANETLGTLHSRVWDAGPAEEFNFEPLPPGPRRITELLGLGTAWYQEVVGEDSAPPVEAPNTKGGHPKKAFHRPEWLVGLMQQGDWAGVRWHTSEQIQTAANNSTVFTPDPQITLSPNHLEKVRSLWESMVPVADGPDFTDRTGRVEQSRLFVNREDPNRLLIALGRSHPPSVWAPAGQTRASVDAMVVAYFFPGTPPQATLPFQARLFLATQASTRGEFRDIENRLVQNPFTDMLPWGSSQPTDPYPEQVTLGRIPVGELRRYLAQATGTLPRTSIRTRFSRAIIQLVDYRGAFFADLFFRPAPHPEFGEGYNTRFEADFPAATPVDVVGALSGFACIGADRIRSQAEDAENPNQQRAMEEIIAFLGQAPAQ